MSRIGPGATGQSKPSGWFIDSSALEPLSSMLCSRSAFAVARKAPHPPAGGLYGAKTGEAAAPGSGLSGGEEGRGGWSLMMHHSIGVNWHWRHRFVRVRSITSSARPLIIATSPGKITTETPRFVTASRIAISNLRGSWPAAEIRSQ